MGASLGDVVRMFTRRNFGYDISLLDLRTKF